MFEKIPNGTKLVLKDAHGVEMECWLPPVGYGRNSITGEIEKTDIIKRSSKKSEQYWEREGLPSWWDKKRANEINEEETRWAKIEEREKRKEYVTPEEKEDEFIDPECEKIRQIHWGRRLRGVWFYNNGVPTYLTGLHWMLLECWKFQGKYFDFRIPNMEFFYFIDYCIEDPNCLGDIEITKRKEGKTARAGLIIYEYISRTDAKHGGVQSKSDPDAAEVFQKAIINPWQKLPDFFRPTFDDIKGDNPEKELRFFNSSRKGRSGRYRKREQALESFIDFKARGEMAYDGPELHRYVSDEAGKLKDVSILRRHNVVQFCSEVDGQFIGFHHYTTTVEEMENGGGEFQKLVRMSNRNELDPNGRTKSGLYVYFLAAYRTLYYDKHGFPDEEKAKEYYLNRRKALQNDPRELSSFIRKNPFTLNECFRIDGETCLYDPEKLNIQLEAISWRSNLTERGNLVWKNGERLTDVEWVKDKTGRFERCIGYKIAEPNKIVCRNGNFYPNNNFMHAMGADPFKYDRTKDQRRSDCAAFGYKKFDALHKTDPFNDAFIFKYCHRAASTAIQYEDCLKMAWILGCQILFESNIDGWKAYFKEHKCEGFLMKLPGEQDFGLYSDGRGTTHQMICDFTEAYINEHIEKVFFKSLIGDGGDTGKGWLQFDVGNTTVFDEPMAAGYTLIAARQKTYRRPIDSGRDVADYFPTYKAN